MGNEKETAEWPEVSTIANSARGFDPHLFQGKHFETILANKDMGEHIVKYLSLLWVLLMNGNM